MANARNGGTSDGEREVRRYPQRGKTQGHMGTRVRPGDRAIDPRTLRFPSLGVAAMLAIGGGRVVASIAALYLAHVICEKIYFP